MSVTERGGAAATRRNKLWWRHHSLGHPSLKLRMASSSFLSPASTSMPRPIILAPLSSSQDPRPHLPPAGALVQTLVLCSLQ